jgi:hypothetical protein
MQRELSLVGIDAMASPRGWQSPKRAARAHDWKALTDLALARPAIVLNFGLCTQTMFDPGSNRADPRPRIDGPSGVWRQSAENGFRIVAERPILAALSPGHGGICRFAPARASQLNVW